MCFACLVAKKMKEKTQKYRFFNFLGNQLFEEEHEQFWGSEKEYEQFWGRT